MPPVDPFHFTINAFRDALYEGPAARDTAEYVIKYYSAVRLVAEQNNAAKLDLEESNAAGIEQMIALSASLVEHPGVRKAFLQNLARLRVIAECSDRVSNKFGQFTIPEGFTRLRVQRIQDAQGKVRELPVWGWPKGHPKAPLLEDPLEQLSSLDDLLKVANGRGPGQAAAGSTQAPPSAPSAPATIDQVVALGEAAYLAGDELGDNPFRPGTPMARAWGAGWTEAHYKLQHLDRVSTTFPAVEEPEVVEEPAVEEPEVVEEAAEVRKPARKRAGKPKQKATS